jgi:hypothetical protein
VIEHGGDVGPGVGPGDGEDRELGEAVQRRVQQRRGRSVTIGTAVLAAVMAVSVLDGIGIVDAVGVDSATARAESGAVELSVRYPTVARPGLAAPFEVVVSHDGGFPDDTVRIAVDDDFLAIWDFNGVVPAPSGETSDGDMVVWELDAPDGDVLAVRLDARIEPARQRGVHGRVAVLDPSDPNGGEVVAVDFTTAVRP